MAIKLKDGSFSCSVCGSSFSSPAHADACRDAHQLIYLPITVEELNRLWNALVLGDVSIVPQTLLDTIRKYSRALVIKNGSQN